MHAQNGWGSELTDFTEKFAKKYLAIDSRESAEEVSIHMMRDVTVNYTSFNLTGQKRIVSGDWRDFLRTAENQLADTTVQKLYEWRGVKFDSEVGNHAIATFQLEYETRRQNLPQTKGIETITLVCRKVDNDWLVADFKLVSIETERFRGNCQCEIFAMEEDKYAAKTTAPNGKSYQVHLQEFVFSVCDYRKQVHTIVAGKHSYKWVITGELYLTESPEDCSPQPTTPLGLAASKVEVVRLIIEKHLLVANCTSVTLKK
jgi:hypothetical protein